MQLQREKKEHQSVNTLYHTTMYVSLKLFVVLNLDLANGGQSRMAHDVLRLGPADTGRPRANRSVGALELHVDVSSTGNEASHRAPHRTCTTVLDNSRKRGRAARAV